MLDMIELSDPSQLEVAAVVSAKMAAKSPSAPDGQTSTTQKPGILDDFDRAEFNRTAEDQEVYETMTESVGSAEKLLEVHGWTRIERAKRLVKRFVKNRTRFLRSENRFFFTTTFFFRLLSRLEQRRLDLLTRMLKVGGLFRWMHQKGMP